MQLLCAFRSFVSLVSTSDVIAYIFPVFTPQLCIPLLTIYPPFLDLLLTLSTASCRYLHFQACPFVHAIRPSLTFFYLLSWLFGSTAISVEYLPLFAVNGVHLDWYCHIVATRPPCLLSAPCLIFRSRSAYLSVCNDLISEVHLCLHTSYPKLRKPAVRIHS